MIELSIAVVGARAEPYAAVPTLAFEVQLAEASGIAIHAVALRCQIQIEARRRPHSATEKGRLLELFGEPERWGETLRTLLWGQASVLMGGFRGATTTSLPLVCTYDFEVIAAKYLQALDDGDIPLRFLWSGTVFSTAGGDGSFRVEPIPWEKEAVYRLLVRTWRETMDRYFPDSAWIRLRRESFDALHRFKGKRALPTWDDAVAALLAAAGDEAPA
jgi:hypothetical protein